MTQEELLDRNRGKRGPDSHRKGCGEAGRKARMDGQKGKQLKSMATPMCHTKDVGLPPSSWRPFGSP